MRIERDRDIVMRKGSKKRRVCRKGEKQVVNMEEEKGGK